MTQKLLKLDELKFRRGVISYLFWSDGTVEKMVTINDDIVFYQKIIANDTIESEFDVSCKSQIL